MLRLSNLPIKTLKTSPKVSDNKSTSLLLQAGFIRQVMAGVYIYTTLGLKVLRNIENIIRQEMDNAGFSEILMTGLSPRDVWDKTGRWEIEEYFTLPTYGDKFYRLNPTHEEIVVPLMKEFINSYKDSESCVYQIQTKYRNEKRAKSGLLRGREFLMKDAYSFHSTDEGFRKFYENVKEVYMKIFNRLGIGKDTYITLADGGVFTDKYSHEFQTILDIGEDVIYIDEKSGISYNQEVAPSKIGVDNITENKLFKREDIEHSEEIIGVDALENFLKIPKIKATKTMFFETDDNRFIVASVRGDYEINTLKLRNIVGCKDLKLASEELVIEKTGAKIGYAGIINLKNDIEIFLDDSIKGMTNFETGTNKTGFHSININFGVDIELPKMFYDFKDAKLGDKNPETGNIYTVKKACEVGNIFPLETKFSKPFDLKMLDENNKEIDVIMGCYGIGVSRLMGVIAEYFYTEKGIKWPLEVAPATYYIIVMGEENLEKAKKIGLELESKGEKVIIDDRFSNKIGFGQKAGDCELFGIPNRIVISPKTIEQGGYEISYNGEKETIIKI